MFHLLFALKVLYCNLIFFSLKVDFEASIAENRFIVKQNISPVIDESEWYPIAFLFLME